MALYAQSAAGTHTTNSSSWTSIPGLTLTIPEGVGTIAIVVLNIPFPYATGNNTPGGNFGININGAVSPVVAGFTYNEQVPQSTGRVPTTLVVGVPLGNKPQVITGVWSNVRGSTVIIDTPATLTAVF
ncbi:hypothetical protein IC762_28830 [Bradyrhizobium genosp. L]|uniref:hypothetical protein n=1 Tax=Bradyrhizobium genosp. L TaxID=83637 RepID=UPI0018A3305E|nr:hypothetical protein [Bradyrhizobium genosp. L]QPF83667.1 hypothetical protein IC762_28830 [Bradyrhizobium genosp. L]